MSSRWASVEPGDIVTLRPKRGVGSTATVTVREVLERHRADGRGLIDTDGATYREFYFDVINHGDSAPGPRPAPRYLPRRQEGVKRESYRPIRWSGVQPGDVVTLRPKRHAGQPVTTTVAQLLDRDRADGRGIVNTEGETYREFFYDIYVHHVPDPDGQRPLPGGI